MPSLGMMTINALACADSVLIPVQAAYLPVKGLQQRIKTIGRVRKQLKADCQILYQDTNGNDREEAEILELEQLAEAFAVKFHLEYEVSMGIAS